MDQFLSELEQALLGIGDWFSTPIGAGLKELLTQVIPFFDILYAWISGLVSGNSLFIQEKLTFPLDDVIMFLVISMLYIFITAVLDEVWPAVSKKKFIKVACTVIAVAVNAMLNYDAAQIITYSGNEVLASIMNSVGKTVLIVALLIGCVIVFIKKLRTGAPLIQLIIKAGAEIAKKAVELSIFFTSAAFVVLIIELLTSDLSIETELRLSTILLSIVGLVALAIIHYLVDKIFSLVDA